MGPIDSPETSVNNYQSMLRKIPEERRYNEKAVQHFDFRVVKKFEFADKIMTRG